MEKNTPKVDKNETQERILGRKLARELTLEELSLVSGGHIPPEGETCSGQDCDVAK